MTTHRLADLASLLGGEFTGNPDVLITGVVHPLQARSEQDMALILDAAILPRLTDRNLQTALVPTDVEVPHIPNQLKVPRPKLALARLLEVFDRPVQVENGIHPSAVIDPTAQIGENVQIGPLCRVGPEAVIGDGTRLVSHVSVGAQVSVGENCLFHAGARIGDRCQIGHRVILQPNAVIGADGFSFVTAEKGSIESVRESGGQVTAQNTDIIRINSIGFVVLEDDVEIGANTCVDRGTLGETRIKRGSKLDNLVQVGHNCTIGENCLIAGHTGISGSVKVGDRVVMGGQVGIRDHVSIGEDAILIAKCGVTKDLAPRGVYIGEPAEPRKVFLHGFMQLKRARHLPKRVDELNRRLEALEAALPANTTETAEVEQPV